MTKRPIRKSFRLESEPVLSWPKSPAKLDTLKGYSLRYSGRGMEYTLHPDTAGAVELVGWPKSPAFDEWRDVFSETELNPSGLITLSQLSTNPTRKQVLEWISKNGLLGFRPTRNTGAMYGNPIPMYSGDVFFYTYEPIYCLLLAAKQAANVLALWSALKKSYATGGGIHSTQAIRSVVNIKEEIQYSTRCGSEPFHYRTLVNGEDRNQWPIPDTPRGWRLLACH